MLSMTVLLCFSLQLLVWRRLFPQSFVVPSSLTTRRRDNHHKNGSDKKHTSLDYNNDSINRVVHVGQFGLGHRLSKLSAAHHLAERLDVPILQVLWNDCAAATTNMSDATLLSLLSGSDNNNNMFHRLFQSSEIPIRTINQTPTQNKQQQQGKILLVRNDVHGYYAGQAYKNFQIPINDTIRKSWNEKLECDHRFFLNLQERFVSHHPSIRIFQQQHNWDNHHVIGVHIRAGNGEMGHFVEAQRGTWISNHNNNNTTLNIPRVLKQFIASRLQQQSNQLEVITKPILVFVATDTVDWINVIQNTLSSLSNNISVISFPQTRVERGQGVGFSTWKDPDDADRCVDLWIASAMDMFLLAATDTLIATARSTFTQILPLSIVLSSGKNGTFCELRPDQTNPIECFRTIEQWLFPNQDHISSVNTTNNAHKVMVHLPDVFPLPDRIFEDAKQFLSGTAPLSANERLYFYGRKFNPRFRAKRPFQTSWTFQT